jgi:hypothetical protein
LRYVGGTILPASIIDELRRRYVEYDEVPESFLRSSKPINGAEASPL